ncbi:MAG: hypothetical protein ACYS1A_08285 [Planctomycetota bacterium]|jgi:hypothetical protein
MKEMVLKHDMLDEDIEISDWFEYNEDDHYLINEDNEANNGDIIIDSDGIFYLLKREVVERDAALPRYPRVTETEINQAIDVFVRNYCKEYAGELTLIA